MADMDRLIAMEKAKLGKAKQVDAPFWFEPLATAIQNIPIQQQKARMYKKNDLNAQAEGLEALAGLVRDKPSLDNFVNVSTNISNEMRDFPSLVANANVIEQFTANMSNDYDTYSTEMERGAKIIDAPNFLDTQVEFADLGKSIKGMTLEDGKTPKYEGTLDYLVKENDKLNSILGRIETSSKATQFRYNKNSTYTDQEIKEKLSSYQKRISVAVQTAIGNGEITPQEAEFIMLGDVKAYKEKKKEKVRTLHSQYKTMDSAQKTIANQLQRLGLKGIKDSDAKDLARIFKLEFQAIEGADENIDTEVDGISIEQMIEDLNTKNKQIAIAKSRTMSSYEAWEGMPMFDAPKATKSETGDLLQNIMEDDGTNINNPLKNLNPEKAKERAFQINLDEKQTWGADSVPKSYRDKWEEGGNYSDQPWNPLYAIDGVYQYPELFKKKKKKAPKLTYDPAMGDTTVARNKARTKKYKISPQQLGDLEDQWSEENSGETFDAWLDKAFKPAGLDADIEKMWKSLSKEDKAKYRSLANFKKNWK